MNRISTLFASVAIAASAMLLTSCDNKELCYVHPHSTTINVEFDWTDAPEDAPKMMRVYFYPEDGKSKHQFFDIDAVKGGDIEIPMGRYLMMTYNTSLPGIMFDGHDSFDSHRAYTRPANILEPIYGSGMPVPPRAEGTEDEPVVLSPDKMVGCVATEVEITPRGICYVHGQGGTESGCSYQRFDRDHHRITLYPHSLVCEYSYEVRNVKNLKHVHQISAAISGMAGALSLSDEAVSTEPVTLPLNASKHDATTVRGEFYTFGHHTEVAAPHTMTFYVVMDDGAKYYYTGEKYNVTKQVHDAANPRKVHLVIDGLDLPIPIENGTGFQPSVDDWNTIDQEIIM